MLETPEVEKTLEKDIDSIIEVVFLTTPNINLSPRDADLRKIDLLKEKCTDYNWTVKTIKSIAKEHPDFNIKIADWHQLALIIHNRLGSKITELAMQHKSNASMRPTQGMFKS